MQNIYILLLLIFIVKCGTLKFSSDPIVVNNQNKGKEKVDEGEKKIGFF